MKSTYVFLAMLLVFSVVAFAQENATNETSNDTVVPPPQIVCDQSRCDNECVKCSDRQCHPQGFICTEDVMIEKFFPNPINLGENQINIALRNTGNVALTNIFATISGDGIETLDKIPLEKFKAGDKDYVFVKINATKSGTIDIVIKLYVGGNVKNKYADQITVNELPKVVENVTAINVTALTATLDSLKQKYKLVEQDYQTKKSQGYIFSADIVFDKLRQISNYLTDAQTNIFEGDYKKAQGVISIIRDSLNDIEDQLKSAIKPQETFSDKIKNNLLFFGSLAAVVSIFTAYRLIQEKVDKDKLIELHRKLSSSKKGKKKSKKAKKKKEIPIV